VAKSLFFINKPAKHKQSEDKKTRITQSQQQFLTESSTHDFSQPISQIVKHQYQAAIKKTQN